MGSRVDKIWKEKNLNIPNMLTVLRLFLLPFFAWSYLSGNLTKALTIYVIAQVSDLLDGFIARRLGQITSFGKLVDPLADKLTLLTVLCCFGLRGQVPWWVIGVMIAKEGLMILGSLYALRRDVVVQALWPGKVATVLFAATVISFLLHWTRLAYVLLYLAVPMALLALVMYIIDLQQLLRDAAKQK